MILSSAKLGRLKLAAKPFAAGGAGEVYRAEAPDGAEYCVKLLTKPKSDDFKKLSHMIAHAPSYLEAGWGKLCWPIDLVHKQRVAEPAGYVMSLGIDESLELSYLTNLRWPGTDRPALDEKVDRKSADGLKKRLVVACNIAAAVHHLHRMGHVFVDLKPQNILISPEGKVSVVDLDSVQLEVGNKIYWGPLGSPDYMPSESYQMQYGTGPAIRQNWDCFSLAVIVYEILLGIHPYTGALKPSAPLCPTIADSIKARMYVHGVNRPQFQVIPPPHEGLSRLPTQIITLFSNAFESTRPEGRPTAEVWGQALYHAAKHAGADLKPEAKSGQGPAPGRASIPTPVEGAPPQNCWGAWGKTCPHELTGRFKNGIPNAAARGGLSVYLCEDCIRGP